MHRLRRIKLGFLFIVFQLLTIPLSAFGGSDLDKEKRWSEQIVDSLMVGDAIQLSSGGQDFLGLFTEETTGEPRGGVIVLHGSGVHPNWNDVVFPLRSELPEYGWSTLSIQLPVLANDAEHIEYAPLIAEAAPRIQAAAAHLREQGADYIAIVAHSLGATMGAAALAMMPEEPPADAFVAIGMGSSEADPALNSVAYLEKIQLPTLDLYGSRDLESVMKTRDARAKAARKAGNENYQQLEVEGADHFFVGNEEELVRRVRGWLQRNQEKQASMTP